MALPASTLSRSPFFFLKNSLLLSSLSKLSPVRSAITSNITNKTFSNSVVNSAKNVDSTLFYSANVLRRPVVFNSSSSIRQFSTYSLLRQIASTANVSASSAVDAAAINRPRINKSSWPANSHKNVGYLCIGTSILVFAIVILGGLTRLTESGLSITEWKPVTGSIPPLSEEDWQAEFDKYKESPEFKKINSHITLEEFKFIYSMEWSHRLLGRIIGTVFVLPTLYYIARKKTSPIVAAKLLGICCLIGLQGAIGWWMVYSGIDEKQLEERRSKPTVSQYRLTAHLGAAFLVYCAMISTGMSILRDHKIIDNPDKYLKIFQKLQSPSLQRFRLLSNGLLGLVFLTAMSGGLVAGLDAGLIYNTFPHMGDDYIPSKNELMSEVFARKEDKSDLFWRNMLENPTMVQLNHRILAVTTFFSVFGIHMYSHRIKSIIPKQAYKTLNISMGLVSLQVALGISTLIYLVPTELAAAHQGGALALLTGVLVLTNFLKKPTKTNLILLRNVLNKANKTATSTMLKA